MKLLYFIVLTGLSSTPGISDKRFITGSLGRVCGQTV